MAINIGSNKLESMVIKDSMRNLIQFTMTASLKNNAAFPNTLITGPPGTGKSTLAMAIVNEHFSADDAKGVPRIKTGFVNAAALANGRGYAALIEAITSRRDGGIIVIDEIHALPKLICETLYTLFDYGKLCMPGGDLKINNFTIIGCTTDPQKMPPPLMDRMTFKLRLGNYDEDDIISILKSRMVNIKYDDDALQLIAKISRSVPRVAIQNLTNMNNFATANNYKLMKRDRIIEALALMGIDENGLSEEDKTVLQLVFENQPVSLTLLTSMMNMDAITYQNSIEMPLIANGYIRKTPKGRIPTQKTIDLLYN